MKDNRIKFISIAKAIAIISVVIGHSGAPEIIRNFVYIYHLPLFFFFSGYFQKSPNNINELGFQIKKLLKGLYLKYLYWSIPILLFHNIFTYLYIYPIGNYYSFGDYVGKGISMIILMGPNEDMLGAFWFLKALLICSILAIIILYVLVNIKKSNINHPHRTVAIVITTLCLTLVCSKYNLNIPGFGKAQIYGLGFSFYMTGYLCGKIDFREAFNKLGTVQKFGLMFLLFTILCLCSNIDHFELVLCDWKLIFPYYIVACGGIVLMTFLSLMLEKSNPKALCYIGNNTLTVLALHFLSFKVVSCLIIQRMRGDISQLSEFPVLIDHGYWEWIFYTTLGVGLPIILKFGYDIFAEKYQE